MYMQPAGSAMQTAVNIVSNATQAFSGVSYIGQDPLGGRFFNGSLDDVRIYNSSLSAAQITQLYDSYFPPTVNTPAAASPTTATGKTTTLSASGSSILGANNLTYTWSSSGPGTVAFSPNGVNAASSTVATFSAAGTYTLGVTIADTYGQFTTSSVNVTVNQTLTSIAVALATNNLATTGVEQFAATAYDQFNYAIVNQPTFTWGVSSVGNAGVIDSNGNYQPPYTTGSATVSATAGGKTGQATATYPGIAQWSSPGGGLWSGGSWIGTTSTTAVSPPGLRGVAGDYAEFATSGGMISLGGASPVDPSLAGLTFASANSYTLSGGAMTLGDGANPATIGVSNGNHTIVTPLTLQSNLNVTVLAGDSLTILGGVGGDGESLTMNGPGKLVLGGTNGFNGGTTVLSGTLVLAGPSALPDGSNLAVGANVASLFGAVIAAANVASVPADAAASAAASGAVGPSADASGGGRPAVSASIPPSLAATAVSAAPADRSDASPSTPDLGASRAARDAALATTVARRSAAGVGCITYSQSAMASDGQEDGRTTNLRALDAVLAAYYRSEITAP
jgi:autotransporter-associated beta strand protein